MLWRAMLTFPDAHAGEEAVVNVRAATLLEEVLVPPVVLCTRFSIPRTDSL